MKTTWSLDAIYKGLDDPAFLKDWEELPGKIEEFNAFTKQELGSGNVENPVGKIEKYLTMELALSDTAVKLGAYFSLTLSTDSTNNEIARYEGQYDNRMAELSPSYTIFKEFVGSLDNLEEVIKGSPLLEEHAFHLKEVAEQSHHTGTQQEEALLAKLRSTGSTAWQNQFNQLTSTVLIEADIKDQPEKLTLSAIRNLAYDKDQEVRKGAYQAELAGYSQIDKAVANSLNAIKGEAQITAELRGYDSILDMTLDSSRMDMQTLDAMWAAIQETLPDFRAYLRRKGELLGHENGLPFYDLFAPVGSANLEMTYEQAAEQVVETLGEFNPEMGEFVQYAFENEWIDVYPKEGKRGGAFCSTIVPIQQSRILTNFSGSFDGMITLAHELGHAYHGKCLREETILNSRYSMPIAETASTFNEILMTQTALKTATPEESLSILENYLMGVTQTSVDIYSRYLFETRFIESRENGPVSVEETKELMLEAQRDAYGDGLDQDWLHPYMWLNKPHYYTASRNFYNFPYAYGQLFALGLYARYEKEGDDFLPKYDALLAATGKHNLRDVGLQAGIDVREKEFWASSLAMVAKDIQRFLALSETA